MWLGRQRARFRHSARGELQWLAPAKAFGLDAFNMTVPGQDDLGHRGFVPDALRHAIVGCVIVIRTADGAAHHPSQQSLPWRSAGCNGMALVSAYRQPRGVRDVAAETITEADEDCQDKVHDPTIPAIADEARWISRAVENFNLIAHRIFRFGVERLPVRKPGAESLAGGGYSITGDHIHAPPAPGLVLIPSSSGAATCNPELLDVDTPQQRRKRHNREW